MKSFLGFDSIPHVFVKDKDGNSQKEDAFLYLLRHTLGRPRDIIEMGHQIKIINGKESTRSVEELKDIIHENSSKLLNEYKKEVIPYFDFDEYKLYNGP